jgi:hypothetical protein
MNKKFVFEIESYEGITMMAFEITINGDELEITQTMDCNHADTDSDYIFETDANLYRIQSDVYHLEEA